MADIINSINRFFSGIGGVLCGESVKEQSGWNESMEKLRQEHAETLALIDSKNAQISELSDKLDEQTRLAETRLDRIRVLEIQTMTAPNAGEPVPTVTEPRTNGGRIRAMTDIELAAFLANMDKRNESDWLDWLGSKVTNYEFFIPN